MAKVLEILLLFLSLTASTKAGENCYNTGTFFTHSTYCDYGCCESSSYRYCCSSYSGSSSINNNSESTDNLYIWIIVVPSVIGAIIFLACIITCICCAIKKSNRPGMTIQPAQGGVAMVSTVNPGPSYGYPQPGVAQQQAGYQPHQGFQPNYTQPINPPNQTSDNIPPPAQDKSNTE